MLNRLFITFLFLYQFCGFFGMDMVNHINQASPKKDHRTKNDKIERLLAEAKILLKTNPTVALRIAEYAYQQEANDSTINLLYRILGDPNNYFYKRLIPDHFSEMDSTISTYTTKYFSVSNHARTSVHFFKGRPSVHFDEGFVDVSVHPSYKYILTFNNDYDCPVKLWDKTGQYLLTINEKGVFANFSPNGKLILTSDYNKKKQVKLWSLKGKLVATIDESAVFANFSPDGKYIRTYNYKGDGKKIKLWDLNGRLIATIHEKGAYADFSPNGKYLLTHRPYYFNKPSNVAVKLWDIKGNLKTTIDEIRSLGSFSPNGHYILTSGNNNKIKLWSLSGESILHFRSPYRYGRFFNNGKHIALYGGLLKHQSHAGNIQIWDINGNMIHTIEESVGFWPMFYEKPNIVLLSDIYGEYKWFKLRYLNDLGRSQKYLYPLECTTVFPIDNRTLYSEYDYGRLLLEWPIQHTNLRKSIINAYAKGLPFRVIQKKVETYLGSKEVARLTKNEKLKIGISTNL